MEGDSRHGERGREVIEQSRCWAHFRSRCKVDIRHVADPFLEIFDALGYLRQARRIASNSPEEQRTPRPRPPPPALPLPARAPSAPSPAPLARRRRREKRKVTLACITSYRDAATNSPGRF